VTIVAASFPLLADDSAAAATAVASHAALLLCQEECRPLQPRFSKALLVLQVHHHRTDLASHPRHVLLQSRLVNNEALVLQACGQRLTYGGEVGSQSQQPCPEGRHVRQGIKAGHGEVGVAHGGYQLPQEGWHDLSAAGPAPSQWNGK